MGGPPTPIWWPPLARASCPKSTASMPLRTTIGWCFSSMVCSALWCVRATKRRSCPDYVPYNAPGQPTHSIAIADGRGGGWGAVIRKTRLHGVTNHPSPAESIARSRRPPIRPGIGFPGRVRVFARSLQSPISPFVPPPRLFYSPASVVLKRHRNRREDALTRPERGCGPRQPVNVWPPNLA